MSSGVFPKTPNIDELKALANTLKMLLESPEPGLFTWRYAVADLCKKIGDFGS